MDTLASRAINSRRNAFLPQAGLTRRFKPVFGIYCHLMTVLLSNREQKQWTTWFWQDHGNVILNVKSEDRGMKV